MMQFGTIALACNVIVLWKTIDGCFHVLLFVSNIFTVDQTI